MLSLSLLISTPSLGAVRRRRQATRRSSDLQLQASSCRLGPTRLCRPADLPEPRGEDPISKQPSSDLRSVKPKALESRRVPLTQSPNLLLVCFHKAMRAELVDLRLVTTTALDYHLSFAYVEGESLLMGLKEVAVSSGSACTSASSEPSYVLRALRVDEDMARTSIRFGIERFTTEEEIDRAVKFTVEQVKKLREMNPLYEMVKKGINIKHIQWSQH